MKLRNWTAEYCALSPTGCLKIGLPVCGSHWILPVAGSRSKTPWSEDWMLSRFWNKELLIVPGAVHCDLYDDVAGVIPHDRIAAFFRENL